MIVTSSILLCSPTKSLFHGDDSAHRTGPGRPLKCSVDGPGPRPATSPAAKMEFCAAVLCVARQEVREPSLQGRYLF